MERYVLRGGQLGYERLQLLARVHRPGTAELFLEAGIRPGMVCLDLGCGGGEVTFDLARLVEPGGTVTGIDMDEDKLALARQSIPGQGVTNVEFLAQNVSDWDEPGRYDVVYCRFLLQHLSDPVGLLRRMWAAVRPGGMIAVEDADFDGLFCDPPNSGFEFWRTMYPRVCALNGGDPAIGRKLRRYFFEAGIPEPELRLRQGVAAEGDVKDLAVSTVDASAEAIIAAGLATREELTAALADLTAFAARSDTIMGDPRIFQLWTARS
jgi:2-polyprenyl-3-methyl-5-hydroxy-6-metoxy-1,4-benzoquinol methylase